jgi:hypothetical protein
MLEIINEPVFDRREEEWNILNARLAAVIRQNAPPHTIVTSGPNWGGIDGLKQLKLLPDQNVIYSFHCYDPFAFTHQGATWSGDAVKPLRDVPYPSSPEAVEPLLPALESSPASKKLVESYGKERWNKDKLAARFRQGIEWGARNKVPLYCGEFGVFPRAASRNTGPTGFAISARCWPRTALAGRCGVGMRALAWLARRWTANPSWTLWSHRR